MTSTSTTSQERTIHNSPSQSAYAATPGMGSIISTPRRCNLWGNAKFRGNCDGTLFKELVLRYRPNSVADPMMGSGTTRDVMAGLNRANGTSTVYWGDDLSNGFNAVTTKLPGQYDFVWLHPPYWNIIRYSNHMSDLSCFDDYNQFSAGLKLVVRNCVGSLTRRGRLAVLIGDVRKQGRYYFLGQEVMRAAEQDAELQSVIIKAQHNVWSDRKDYRHMEHVPIKHEYCLVFQRRS